MDRYPVLIGGDRRGELRVYTDGLFTVFEAEAEDTGSPLRLAVYGGGEEAVLGVMLPDGAGRVRIRRRLSRRAASGLPKKIEYAAPAGSEKPGPERKAEPAGRSSPHTSPAEPGDTLWYSSPDGTLSTFDGRRLLVALPAEDPRVPRGAESVVREINGRKYVVFPR